MNWLKKVFHREQSSTDVTNSILYNELTFYNQFIKDLLKAKEEVIIESPYLTTKRLKILIPIFTKLKKRNVRVFIITRDPKEHDEMMAEQSEAGICFFESAGHQVLLVNGRHHRKLAMIDRKVLWEGSLNILSQTYSRELMRRIESRELTNELFHFLKLNTLDVFNK